MHLVDTVDLEENHPDGSSGPCQCPEEAGGAAVVRNEHETSKDLTFNVIALASLLRAECGRGGGSRVEAGRLNSRPAQ